jgi:hypothetical protein
VLDLVSLLLSDFVSAGLLLDDELLSELLFELLELSELFALSELLPFSELFALSEPELLSELRPAFL